MQQATNKHQYKSIHFPILQTCIARQHTSTLFYPVSVGVRWRVVVHLHADQHRSAPWWTHLGRDCTRIGKLICRLQQKHRFHSTRASIMAGIVWNRPSAARPRRRDNGPGQTARGARTGTWSYAVCHDNKSKLDLLVTRVAQYVYSASHSDPQ